MSKRSFFVIVALAVVLTLAACGGTQAPPPTQPPTPTKAPPKPTEAPKVELSGDSLRGGLLYDAWWEVIGADAPEEDHPLWATQSTNTRSGADTWRCKECHGWDYKGKDGVYGSGSHMTGFPGVMDAVAKGPAYLLDALKGKTNPDHDFSTVLDEQSLIDLALFMAEETVDTNQFIGADKKAKGGDVDTGGTLFGDICADCHGSQGLAMNFHDEAEPEYVGTIGQDNPWEFFHKMRVGQPGEPDMASALDQGWSEEEQLAVLAFVQTLPTSSPTTEGGRLYDKWWEAIGAEAPEGDQPLWATQSTNTRSGADTWRCKECHGWDYKGKDGVYGSGSHMTGFPGIFNSASKSAEELIAWFDGSANPDHDFSPYLSEEQIAMLVAFIQQGMGDRSEFINTDKTVNGDVSHGQELYTNNCARCHGEEGKDINFGDEGSPEYVGTVASDNPWEAFHKVSFGQPGEHMPAGINLGLSQQDIADLVTFLQTLPTE